MLFNSYLFVLVFLPVTVAGFYLIGGRGHHRVALSWLVAASFFFYAWWNTAYLGLILGSILFNYAIGAVLSDSTATSRRALLVLGIAANLALLGYFKYANFFVDNLNLVAGTGFTLEKIVLPLAISFFTFQQISFLVDAYDGQTREYSFLHYCLFVTFFPQLIAGPIVHHREMLPQFAKDAIYVFKHEHLAVGTFIFVLGLFKKVMLADNIALYATPVFDAADHGVALTFYEAWGGALAYSLQLYFDFSGYSDMAIGLARMFGIRLPLNFYSPYKAHNIIEFWRRWHMTLSRFLRDYVYIPLGGNRNGRLRRHLNLMITMLVGGLWHGAGWTFVAWGALHGVYLVINHAWRGILTALGHDLSTQSFAGRTVSILLTFVAVTIAWVFFRATSFHGAAEMLQAMAGFNGIAAPGAVEAFSNGLADWRHGQDLFVLLGLIVFLAPNVPQIMIRYQPVFETYRGQLESWRGFSPLIVDSKRFALLAGLLAWLTLLSMSQVSEFLYFQF
jgi:alginate O-acetyltransferase complex protein AlgI